MEPFNSRISIFSQRYKVLSLHFQWAYFFTLLLWYWNLVWKKQAPVWTFFVLQVLCLHKSKYVNEVLSWSKKWMGFIGRPLDCLWERIVSGFLPKFFYVLHLTKVHPSSEFFANWSSIGLRMQVQVPSAHWVPFIFFRLGTYLICIRRFMVE